MEKNSSPMPSSELGKDELTAASRGWEKKSKTPTAQLTGRDPYKGGEQKEAKRTKSAFVPVRILRTRTLTSLPSRGETSGRGWRQNRALVYRRESRKKTAR